MIVHCPQLQQSHRLPEPSSPFVRREGEREGGREREEGERGGEGGRERGRSKGSGRRGEEKEEGIKGIRGAKLNTTVNTPKNLLLT